MRAASQYEDGRRALAAWHGYRALIAYPDGKREAVRRLLARHRDARTLVLTADDATAYAIARELLIAPITREIGRAERAQTLDRFRRGELSALVSPQVLDEGLDVPDADVAIVVGGSAAAREGAGRIGRMLRPRDGRRPAVYQLVVQDAHVHELDPAQRRRATLAPPRAMEASPRAPAAHAPPRAAPPDGLHRWRLPAAPPLPAPPGRRALLGGAP